METAERYVRTWVASPRDKEIEDTVSGICLRPIERILRYPKIRLSFQVLQMVNSSWCMS
jgi:hypothetical protein